MSKNQYYIDKPVGDSIMDRVALELKLARYGIDIRTPEEIEQDRKDRERAVKAWNDNNGYVE